MKNYDEIKGTKYGRITIISDKVIYRRRGNQRYAHVNGRCDCGRIRWLLFICLRNGSTTSCGYHRKQQSTTHGLRKHPLYNIYYVIHTRCYNPHRTDYERYGGRGIRICGEWRNSIASFVNWALANGWKQGLSIDRINNNDNYGPKNCRWVTIAEQNRNTRRTIKVQVKGKEMCLKDAAKAIGQNYSAVCARIKKLGWSVEKALYTPVKTIKKKGTV